MDAHPQLIMGRARCWRMPKEILMAVLRAVPEKWFSYDFEVLDRTGASVGRADLSNWRENAALEVGGRLYQATHKSGRKEFVLSHKGGPTVLVAEKPSAWRDRFSFEHDGSRYELRKESAWRRNLVLWRDGTGPVGSLRPKGAFKRAWLAELPDDLPPEVGIFLMWLAVLLARRASSAAAGSAAAAGGS